MQHKNFRGHDHSEFTLTIDDPLDTEYAVVRGVQFDVHVTAYLCKIGQHGKPEIVELEYASREISVVCGEYPFKIDTESETFTRYFKKELDKEIERIVLQQAEKYHDFNWELVNWLRSDLWD